MNRLPGLITTDPRQGASAMTALIFRHRVAFRCIALAFIAAGIVVDLYGAHRFGWM